MASLTIVSSKSPGWVLKNGEVHADQPDHEWQQWKCSTSITLYRVNDIEASLVPFPSFSSLKILGISECSITHLPAAVWNIELDSLYVSSYTLAEIVPSGTGPSNLRIDRCSNLHTIGSLAACSRLIHLRLTSLPMLSLLPMLPPECKRVAVECLPIARAVMHGLASHPYHLLSFDLCPLLELQLKQRPVYWQQTKQMTQLITFVLASYAAQRRHQSKVLPPELMLVVARWVCPVMEDVTVYTGQQLPTVPLPATVFDAQDRFSSYKPKFSYVGGMKALFYNHKTPDMRILPYDDPPEDEFTYT